MVMAFVGEDGGWGGEDRDERRRRVDVLRSESF